MPNNIKPTPADEVDRLKNAAKMLHDNPLWQEALDKLEGEYTAAWANTDPVQTTHRENAYYMVQAVKKLRQQMQNFTQVGAIHRQGIRNNVERGGKS